MQLCNTEFFAGLPIISVDVPLGAFTASTKVLALVTQQPLESSRVACESHPMRTPFFCLS